MGRASSSKKVAKAARESKEQTKKRKWAFPAACGTILAVGLGAVIYANVMQSALTPSTKDHFHSAYGVYLCDAFEAPYSDALVETDPASHQIHTHDAGVIHIHPSSSRATGDNANWGFFGENVGMEVGSDSFTTPSGTKYENGGDCNGEEAEVRLLYWPSDGLEGDPEVIASGISGTKLHDDGSAYVLAYAPPDASVPLPPSLGNLENLTDLGPGDGDLNIDVPDNLLPTTAPAAGAGGQSQDIPSQLLDQLPPGVEIEGVGDAPSDSQTPSPQ